MKSIKQLKVESEDAIKEVERAWNDPAVGKEEYTTIYRRAEAVTDAYVTAAFERAMRIAPTAAKAVVAEWAQEDTPTDLSLASQRN